MTLTSKSILIAIVTITAVVGIGWHMTDRPVRIATNAVIVADVSGSTADGHASILGIAETYLNKPKLTEGSTLTVITTGDEKSANEARWVGKYEVPYSRRAFDGKNALLKRKRELLSNLDANLQAVRRTDRSPIFLGVKSAIEQLRAGGCRADSECFLFVRTDGEELSEPAIKRALESTTPPKGLPDPTANEGIKVMFCGLAETNDSKSSEAASRRPVHNARHGDRIRQVWSSLFSVPDLVRFEPYCPKSENTSIAEK